MTTPDQSLIERFPPRQPTTTLVWTAVVNVGEREDLGGSNLGQRFIVPILSGRFYGGAGYDSLSGDILPGGADRQLLRPDGVKELDAIYEMKARDGTILSIHNRVIVDESRAPERYAMSTITATAPSGLHDWLNRRLLIGTLQSARPNHPAVIVRAWLADAGGA